MSKMIRLDKFLANMGIGSRREIRDFGKSGRIKVNENIIKSTDIKIDTESDVITVDGKIITYEEFEYYMLNKPAGVVSATSDNIDKTVIDIIESDRKKDLFPVGRLDKDTVGLLIITDDGKLAHDLLSPTKHVEKKYFAKVTGRLDEDAIERFSKGIMLDDGVMTKPAKLEILKSGEISEVEITISEGRFHQVKRMIADVSGKVIYLKRVSMGKLLLDNDLAEGEYRKLSSEEIRILKEK